MRIGDEHAIQPGVVSVTQTTELGTLYTVDELAALADQAHANGMLLHVDGARLANAAAALDVPLRAITTDVGADVVSFGGTKAGLIFGEAVVFLRAGLGDGALYLRKQSMQLASKMRFVAAQFEALLEDDLWRRVAAHANAMAAVNEGHAPAYGNDPVTARVEARLRELFGEHAHGFLVLNGTGANVVALRSMLQPWQGAIVADSAHLNLDEGGAPEAVAGIKLLTVPTRDGKLTPELVAT